MRSELEAVRGEGTVAAAKWVKDAREAAMAFGAVGGKAEATSLPGDGGAAIGAEAWIDPEGGRVWARSVGAREAAAADGTDPAGAQAIGQQGRQGVIAGGTAFELRAVEILERGIALWAVGLGWTAIAVEFERGLAVGTLLRRGRLRDVVNESKRGAERGELDDGIFGY